MTSGRNMAGSDQGVFRLTTPPALFPSRQPEEALMFHEPTPGYPCGHPVASARHPTDFAQGHREAGLQGEVLDGAPARLVEPTAVAVGIEHADLP